MDKKQAVRNAADPEQVSEAERKDKDLDKQYHDDFKWMLSDPRGRRIFMRMLDETGFQRTSFTGNSYTFFNEGMRNVGLQWWAMMNKVYPEIYPVMLSEQKDI